MQLDTNDDHEVGENDDEDDDDDDHDDDDDDDDGMTTRSIQNEKQIHQERKIILPLPQLPHCKMTMMMVMVMMMMMMTMMI